MRAVWGCVPACVLKQTDYDELRNRMEPLSEAVQKLQAERAELVQQLEQVGDLLGLFQPSLPPPSCTAHLCLHAPCNLWYCVS